ncbi:MAG TPA: acetolactate synthase small subunit, partial [Geobacteraceae bacterium]
YTIEATGAPEKIDAILELLRPLGLKELVRTGPVAIGRGAKGWKG